MKNRRLQLKQFRSVPLYAVKLKDKMYMQAQDAEMDFIRKLEPARVLAGFRLTAGIDTKGVMPYNGWENSLIAGHCLGHYFTACAQAVCISNDKEIGEKLSEVVKGLRECQQNLGTGFLSAATVKDASNVELQFDIEEGKAEGQTWVPWYALHKVLQGMIDVYTFTENETAFEIAKDLGLWVHARVMKWDEKTREKLLRTEYGGMNDSLYSLYRLTKDSRYKEAAEQFDDPVLYEDITSGRKALYGIHANTTIPKFIGALNRVVSLHEAEENDTEKEERYLQYAMDFWELATKEQSYITGGVSDMEHFRKREELDLSRTQCNCESCCAYNLLKLSRGLFCVTGEKKYADYYEHTLRNAILGAINPENGTTTYFSPMAAGYYKYFSHPEPDKNYFWCCTGTGMEDFTKLTDSIYFIEQNVVYLNQYIASEVSVPELGMRLAFQGDVRKSEEAELVIDIEEGWENAEERPEVCLRIPDWSEEFQVFSGSQGAVPPRDSLAVSIEKHENGYIRILSLPVGRTVLSIRYPMKIRAVPLEGELKAVGFMYGPTVLAARLGNRRMDEVVNAGIDVYAPAWKIVGRESARSEVSYAQSRRVLVESEFLTLKDERTKEELLQHPEEFFERAEGEELCYRLLHTDAKERLGEELFFVPYNQITKERYGLYWYFE